MLEAYSRRAASWGALWRRSKRCARSGLALPPSACPAGRGRKALVTGYTNEEVARYCLAHGDAAQQAAGMLCLWNPTAKYNTTNQDAIREAGGIPPLVAMLQHGVASATAQKRKGRKRQLAGALFCRSLSDQPKG